MGEFNWHFDTNGWKKFTQIEFEIFSRLRNVSEIIDISDWNMQWSVWKVTRQMSITSTLVYLYNKTSTLTVQFWIAVNGLLVEFPVREMSDENICWWLMINLEKYSESIVNNSLEPRKFPRIYKYAELFNEPTSLWLPLPEQMSRRTTKKIQLKKIHQDKLCVRKLCCVT